jgi:hypothetical protein
MPKLPGTYRGTKTPAMTNIPNTMASIENTRMATRRTEEVVGFMLPERPMGKVPECSFPIHTPQYRSSPPPGTYGEWKEPISSGIYSLLRLRFLQEELVCFVEVADAEARNTCKVELVDDVNHVAVFSLTIKLQQHHELGICLETLFQERPKVCLLDLLRLLDPNTPVDLPRLIDAERHEIRLSNFHLDLLIGWKIDFHRLRARHRRRQHKECQEQKRDVHEGCHIDTNSKTAYLGFFLPLAPRLRSAYLATTCHTLSPPCVLLRSAFKIRDQIEACDSRFLQDIHHILGNAKLRVLIPLDHRTQFGIRRAGLNKQLGQTFLGDLNPRLQLVFPPEDAPTQELRIEAHEDTPVLREAQRHHVRLRQLEFRVRRGKGNRHRLLRTKLGGQHEECQQQEGHVHQGRHINPDTEPFRFELWHRVYSLLCSGLRIQDLDDVVTGLVNHVREVVHLRHEEVVGDDTDDCREKTERRIDKRLGNTD